VLPDVVDGQVVKIQMIAPNALLSLAEVEVWADTSGAGLTITRQPKGARIYAGKTLEISVGLLDDAGATYQWKKGVEDIPAPPGPP